MKRKLLASVFAASVTLLGVRAASATEVEIVAVMWQQDVSVRDQVQQFFGCLVNSSTFGTTWAAEYGLTRVRFRGVYVLNQMAPSSIRLGGNANQIVEAAIMAGTLPQPVPGGTSYLLYTPPGTRAFDDGGEPACEGTYCGVHNGFNFSGNYIDIALVPIDCPDCGDVQVTLIGEHEAAEAIANMGTSQFEVGDSCEGGSNETQLACCGTSYPIQRLSNSRNEFNCEAITATGSMCGCSMAHMMCSAASDCCSGLTCGAVVEQSGMVCCTASGGTCTTRADCCGGLACTGGHCACAADGDRCVDNSDCCTGTCDAGTKTCGMPGGTGGSGGTAGSGGSGGTAGSGGSGGSGTGGSGGSGTGGSGGGSGGSAGNNATGDTSGGCSVGGGHAGGPVILLFIVLVARRRRSALPSRNERDQRVRAA